MANKSNKTYKLKENNNLMKRVVLSIFSFVFLLMLVNSASAVQFWKYDGLRLDNNVSTYKWGVITYDSFQQTSQNFQSSPSWWNLALFNLLPFNPFGVIDAIAPDYNTDMIESGKPLEIYVRYNIYPVLWNTQAVNNTISSCSLTIKYSRMDMNTTSIIYQQNYSTSDITNAKYFIKLNKGDTFYVEEQCYFNKPSERTLEIPADFTIVTPTWNCQACQYYEWQKDQVKLTKAMTLADYSNQIIGYMKGIFQIFYEFFIYGWWFFLIIMLLFAVSLIFLGIWFAYQFLQKHTR